MRITKLQLPPIDKKPSPIIFLGSKPIPNLFKKDVFIKNDPVGGKNR